MDILGEACQQIERELRTAEREREKNYKYIKDPKAIPENKEKEEVELEIGKLHFEQGDYSHALSNF